MNSTPNPKATEPDDVECADEQLAHVTEQPSKPDHDAARHPSAVPGRRPSRGRPALLGLIGLLLATCIFVAAFVSQSSYGGAAKLRWAAQLVLTSSVPLKKTGLPVQPSPSAAQVVAAESMPSQPTPSAQTAPQEVAPTAAPLSPELAQMLQTMARDLANVEQGIEQLKTSQQQMASDNAKAIEQLKTSQEHMLGTMRRPPSSSRRAKNKSPGSLPKLPNRTCDPRHQRLRHVRLPTRRVSRCRRVRRRKVCRCSWVWPTC